MWEELLALVALLATCAQAFHFGGAPLQSRRHSPNALSMKMEIGGGCYVALTTPFNEDGAIDQAGLRNLLQWHVASGTDGIVSLGTTAEAAMLSKGEKQLVLDITMEEVGGKLPVVVGCGTINPTDVVDNLKMAEATGADASLVVTPYYVKPTQKGLINFYQHVAGAVDLPMVLYNVPGRTQCDMKPETVATCSQIPGVVGIKEATGDLSRGEAIRSLCGKDFLVYSGDDGTGTELVLAGGDGVISVTANVAPSLMAQMIACARQGDR
ncbi:unnamed protein product [Chrysoparadoxa australica]